MIRVAPDSVDVPGSSVEFVVDNIVTDTLWTSDHPPHTILIETSSAGKWRG